MLLLCSHAELKYRVYFLSIKGHDLACVISDKTGPRRHDLVYSWASLVQERFVGPGIYT